MSQENASNKWESVDRPRHAEYIKLLMANLRSLYRFIVTMVPHASDADDILQETSKTIWEKFQDYEPGTDFRNWAITIARYKVLQYYNKKQKSRVIFSSKTVEVLSDHISKDQREDRRDLEILKKCLSKVTKNNRQLINLKYTQGISTKELATRLGRSVSGLYSTMARIHRFLIECVQRNLSIAERS